MIERYNVLYIKPRKFWTDKVCSQPVCAKDWKQAVLCVLKREFKISSDTIKLEKEYLAGCHTVYSATGTDHKGFKITVTANNIMGYWV